MLEHLHGRHNTLWSLITNKLMLQPITIMDEPHITKTVNEEVNVEQEES